MPKSEMQIAILGSRTRAKERKGFEVSLSSIRKDGVGESLDIQYDNSTQRDKLRDHYNNKMIINAELTRSVVSFQANKNIPFYRWLKYKEAFSYELVKYITNKFRPDKPKPLILDPFAGIGTALTTATKYGWHAVGIELLPVGIETMRARLLADTVNIDRFRYYLERMNLLSIDSARPNNDKFHHIDITKNAFPLSTESALSAYVSFLEAIPEEDIRFLFWFACLSILEEISYTRKDGQYLRWDYRSGKSTRSKFSKGKISEFRPAIIRKLELILADIKSLRNGGTFSHNVEIIQGSCLDELPNLPDRLFDLVLTSPPYCNRYDYTRTYALELAFMNYKEDEIKALRQNLLSATVENRSKQDKLKNKYLHSGRADIFNKALDAFNNQYALHEVLDLLYSNKTDLNNPNIPRMVENYFFEMNLVIHELYRVLAIGGKVVMVNDNVQYNGEEVPVDLILSDFAARAGFTVDNIWILSRGKGNSSQQMGIHGRNEMRKCIYVWSK
jgi:DNA modification methylase